MSAKIPSGKPTALIARSLNTSRSIVFTLTFPGSSRIATDVRASSDSADSPSTGMICSLDTSRARSEPATRGEALQQREDLAIIWLHLDGDHLTEARHCVA